MGEREELERRHIGDPEKEFGMIMCVRENGQPNCRSCHGPWYYCSKTRHLLHDKEGYQFGKVGCNRGKAKC